MTTDDRLVSPSLYLSITAEHYMREHLFDSPALVATVCRHFHPDVSPDDVEQWRTQYSSVARPGDRTGLTVHRSERRAVSILLDDAAGQGLDHRETVRLVCRKTLRVFPSVSAAEDLATRVPEGSMKVAWSAEEDAQLLDGHEVRGGSVDTSRRFRLRSLLGYRQSLAVPLVAPVAERDVEAPPAAPEPPAEPPMLTMNVAEGVTVAANQSATAVTVTAGHESILLSDAEAKKLADALNMLGRLTEGAKS